MKKPNQWRCQDFVTGGEVRYESIGGLEYEVPQSRLHCLYQRGSLLDGLAMYLSCDTKKFHDNESTHILHIFGRPPIGGSFPLPLSLAAPCHLFIKRICYVMLWAQS